MNPLLRNIFGAVVVVGSLASVVAGRERPTLELPPPRPAPERAAVPGLDLARLAARGGEGAKADQGAQASIDPFAPRSFGPPAPARAAKPGPAQAGPPPLPFRYLGKMIEDGKLKVFLARGDESVTVRAGSRIGEYRVDRVTERGVEFTYLPLKAKQHLPL